MRKLALASAIIIAAVAVGSVPFNTTLVPEWTVVVIDESGTPYANLEIVQSCESYTFSVDLCGAEAQDRVKATNRDGAVTFPERTIRLSLWSRVFRFVTNLALLLAHGSFGTEAYLSTSGPQGFVRLDYVSGNPPDVFLVPRGNS
ncbi:MAG: hypothetical protein AB7V18_02055 [Pyrinomonadaceae bacterium]